MRRLTPLLGSMMLIGAIPGAAVALTPGIPRVNGVNEWRIADVRELEVDADRLALSPDGRWLAGMRPDDTPCFWDVETLTQACASEQLPALQHPWSPTIAWAPDSRAVAFSLQASQVWIDGDIYLFERTGTTLTNRTEDRFDGRYSDAPRGTPIDSKPSWSPDGEEIVFSRYIPRGDEPPEAAIMRIDRAGGEPVEVITDLPRPVRYGMFWLPDDTVLYNFWLRDPDDPDNGVWRVAIDGGDPVKEIASDAWPAIPHPVVTDVDPETGTFSVYSYALGLQSAETGRESSTPAFWIGNLAEGSLLPVPDVDRFVATADGDVKEELTPYLPAALSPDGTTAFVIYRPSETEHAFATMDTATGELSFLSDPDGGLGPLAFPPPQWAHNNTLLLSGEEARLSLLITLKAA